MPAVEMRGPFSLLTRRGFLSLFGFLALARFGWAANAAENPLRIGLVPVFSPRTLVGLYQPLADYLRRSLGRPVELLTATDFRAFYRQLSAGLYDLALVPPHLARLMELDGGWLPLAIYTAPNRAYVIMSQSRPLRSIDDLRGQRFAIFDPSALNVMLTLAWLRAQGLEPERDFALVQAPGHASVAHAVANGDALLGVVGKTGWGALPPELRERLAIFAEMPIIPSLVWLLHPRLASERQRLQQRLLAFPDTPEGQVFFRTTAYGGLRLLRPHELKSMEPYLVELRRQLQGSP